MTKASSLSLLIRCVSASFLFAVFAVCLSALSDTSFIVSEWAAKLILFYFQISLFQNGNYCSIYYLVKGSHFRRISILYVYGRVNIPLFQCGLSTLNSGLIFLMALGSALPYDSLLLFKECSFLGKLHKTLLTDKTTIYFCAGDFTRYTE